MSRNKLPDDQYFEKIKKMQENLPIVSIINMDPNLLKRQVMSFDDNTLLGIGKMIDFINEYETLNSTYAINRSIVYDELDERKYFFRSQSKKHFAGTYFLNSKN